MKNFIKANLKVLPSIILFSFISVYAAGVLNAGSVGYCPETNNMQAATVSDALDILYNRVDNVPIGTIMPYMGKNAPENYLICDGTVYNIADYQKLADHIKADFGSYNKFGGDGTTTFAVPDLRGEFLRGAGNNSRTGQGNGATVGTHQNATQHVGIYGWGSNQVSVSASNATSSEARSIESNVDSGTGRVGRFNITATFYNNNDSMNSLYTSRPTNTSVNYLIKAN